MVVGGRVKEGTGYAGLGYSRAAEKTSSRKPAQPRSYWPRFYRTVPPCIGPATSSIHRASERFHSRNPRASSVGHSQKFAPGRGQWHHAYGVKVGPPGKK